MGVYYVTGIAGSGKTTVCNELKNRGFTAFDTDDFGRWKNKETGKRITRPAVVDDPEWHDQNQWKLRYARIRQMLAEHADMGDVFLCGTSSNEQKLIKMADRVICLTVDRQVLVERLLERKNSDFGKSPIELGVVVGWHMSLQESHRQRGAIMIDSQQPVDEVVDEILKTVSTNFVELQTA